ncbi:MAG: nitroreductase family protein [Candidatus Heimdallarchaeota archaeon]|nr:nitroreductase family protein [Candidatus Heimdallarchaeota archaeon]
MVEQKNLGSNDLFKIINNRRSIRKFLKKDIARDLIEKILLAGIRAPFAYQATSIVYTTDKEKMDMLKRLGIYPSTNLFMIFLIDFNRLEKIVQQKGYTYNFDDGMLLWLGIQDASLVAENIILAAEACGLGSVLLGNAPLHTELIAKVFKIPKKVIPVVGLCIGYPDPKHLMDIRPRFPLNHCTFKDEYQDYSESDILNCINSMDEGYITQGYYIKLNAKIPLYNKDDKINMDKYSWSEHISRKITQGIWSEKTLLDILREQGFSLK